MKQVIWNDLDACDIAKLLKRPTLARDGDVRNIVSSILESVRGEGDEAVKSYTQQFDNVVLDSLNVDQAEQDLDADICKSIETAYQNIFSFHEKQGFKDFSVKTMDGVTCQRIIRPIDRVGLYVPGGTAPLVSTTLMLGIPAQLAGGAQVAMCTPCDRDGNINPYILYAAKLCGITNIYRVGGAQAIAAMAYGTQTISKVDKIFGPGNAYVTEAKMQVTQAVNGTAIDMPAGPSEVCVIVDDSTNPVFSAADLLSQAEHDVMSQVVLISTSKEITIAIDSEIQKQLEMLTRKDIAKKSIENSVSILAKDIEEAVKISNIYAPEHLILCFDSAIQYVEKIINAGSIFLGQWTPESAGDYASGTNHVLPTYGYARMYSGLSVEAFQKTLSVQEITQKGLQNLGSTVETLAELEGLGAHANAVSVRLQDLS